MPCYFILKKSKGSLFIHNLFKSLNAFLKPAITPTKKKKKSPKGKVFFLKRPSIIQMSKA